MREYDAHAQALTDAGGTLVVLTSDTPELLHQAIAEHGFGARFVSVEKQLWTDWGLDNKHRSKVPYPTTIVVAPDGRVIFREVHLDRKERTSIPTVVDIVAQHRASGALPAEVLNPVGEPDEPEEPAPPDWDNAVALSALQLPGQLTLQLDVGHGFHVYGANETISRPLAGRIDQYPELEVPIPTGEEKTLSEAMGSAWVLEGQVLLQTPLPADAPNILSGELDYQVCTDTSCTAPTSVPWNSELSDDR